MGQVNNSTLRKIGIACKTCGVSDSFYSSMSIKRFRLDHLGHEVTEVEGEAPAAWPPTEPPNVRQNGGKVRLLKVLVELVTLPAYAAPVFTITGVREDLKSAFVQVVSPSQRDQVRETLEKGKYLDSGSSDTVYVWEPKSISFSKDANMAMSFGPPSWAGSNPSEVSPATEEPFRTDGSSTSEEVHEIQTPAPGGEQSAMAANEVVTSGSLRPDSERSVTPRPVSTAATTTGSGEKEEGEVPRSDGPYEAKVEDDNYLLVSKSGYIEAGAENMSEAVRISRLLRPFRWRVEPAYTIGVIVDDILSLETANGEIGGDVTKQIEGAGYRLSRVSVEKGKPVAWFKREQASEPDALGL